MEAEFKLSARGEGLANHCPGCEVRPSAALFSY